MLAIHGLWSPRDEAVVLWAEDSSMPASAPRPRRAAAASRAARHPFAAPTGRIAQGVAELGTFAAVTAGARGTPVELALWLPGAPGTPEASPQLVRADLDGEAGGASSSSPSASAPDGRGRLSCFAVPGLALPPALAVDLLPQLAGPESVRPSLHVGESVAVLAEVAELALEVVAGGRFLPDLAVVDGRHVARWTTLGGGADAQRSGALAAALPPPCRAFTPEGDDPATLVDAALGAFVDALCREGVGSALPSPSGTARGLHPLLAWLAALGAPSGVVAGDAGELAKLEGLVAEWRAGVVGVGGPWRLCFRLREPEAAPHGADGSHPGTGEDASGPWRVELLLQATDDLSLVVDAAEVWSSGDVLRRATRTLEDPHEVLLAELGRAVRAYPELEAVLREPAPVAVATDLAGAHRFLSEVAPVLELAGFGVLLPSWWRNPSSRLGLRMSSSTPGQRSSSGLLTGGSLAAFDWKAALGDDDLGLDELRQLASLKQPLVRVRGQWTELRPDEVARLAAFLTADGPTTRPVTIADALRLAAGLPGSSPVEGVPVVRVEADGLLGALLDGALEHALEVRGTPPGFLGALRPYQARGVAWIEFLERLGLGACLADDMGLGKTATVLAVVQGEREAPGTGRTARGMSQTKAKAVKVPPGPTLVVCPTSVVGNWQREAERFAPDLRVEVHHGAARARGEEVQDRFADADLVVTSYPLVERDRRELATVEWRRIVLDEAQHVKNPAAKQTKAVRALPASRRVALTGTPVENHLGDLWSIMEFLNPGLLGPERAFRERFAIPIERYGDEEAAEQLKTLTRPFMLRRLKTDRSIITDLPDKIEMKVVCSLTREQATLYQAVVDEMLTRIDESEGIERKGLVLAAMLRLKQVCNHPAQYLGDGSRLERRSGKLERTVEVLEEVLAAQERAIVFTQFAEMGHLLQAHLADRLGCRVAFLHGGVARRRRDDMVRRFQDDDGDVPVMVLSVKAGGTGLNLTAANHVVHFDRWWNPAVENQATDRAFRIGQRRDVQVRKLVCAGTVEDRIDQLIESKRDLAERIVGSGEGWLTELSTQELADVLRLSAGTVGEADW